MGARGLIRSRPSSSQSSELSRIPNFTETMALSPVSVIPHAQITPSFGPVGRTGRKIASRNSTTRFTSLRSRRLNASNRSRNSAHTRDTVDRDVDPIRATDGRCADRFGSVRPSGFSAPGRHPHRAIPNFGGASIRGDRCYRIHPARP